ncbi:hypothetical protein R6Y94_22460 [Plantactinospora sp. KLBMP9567]|nr:hypothetical protein [Plantactinospora sp. KLBMP9567]
MSLFLTPAITALLGHAAWWPEHEDTHPVPAGDTDGTSPRVTPAGEARWRTSQGCPHR